MKRLMKRGVTLIELVVVLVIVSLLSTVAVGVYTKEVLRAKIARTRAEIRTIEVAASRYQIDTGQFPPSSTGTALAPAALNQADPFMGSGYLQAALRASLSGNSNAPLSGRWAGPYLDWDENKLGTLSGGAITGSTAIPEVQLLDPFGNPYWFVNSGDYASLGGTELPPSNPYSSTETWYNASTFQIISFGPDGATNTASGQIGTEPDDITNWESSLQ